MTIALLVEHYIDTELDLLDNDSAMNAVYKTGEIQDLVDRIGDEKAVAVLEGTGIAFLRKMRYNNSSE